MSGTWLRVGAGLAAFALVAVAGVAGLTLAGTDVLDAITLVTVVAISAGVATYALIEYAQTGQLASIARQFDTRTLVLMAVAIALNAVLGAALANALKIPIYLDSIGTVLVGVLAGPLAGAATGLLSNLLRTFLAPPPIQDAYAAPFAVVSVVIGLLAGVFARWGWLRPRRGTSGRRLIVGGALTIGAVVVLAFAASQAWLLAAEGNRLVPDSDDAAFLILGWLILLLVVGTALGLGVLLLRWRDLTAAYIVLAGVITGIIAAFIAAPIAAGLFGGVTGSGADFVIAAFRQAGADLEQAVLGQSLISDSIDKVITYFVVYLILGAMATRTKARFPQGEYLLPLPEPGDDGEPA